MIPIFVPLIGVHFNDAVFLYAACREKSISNFQSEGRYLYPATVVFRVVLPLYVVYPLTLSFVYLPPPKFIDGVQTCHFTLY